MKPKLYVGLDGVVLVPGTKPDPMLETEIVSYAKPFMHWATKHFNVQWLTDRGAHHAFYVSDKLGLPQDAVPVKGYLDSKVEHLDPKEHFFWVDAELIPSEVAWLSQHGLADRVVQVDPELGLTPASKEKLEGLLRRK